MPEDRGTEQEDGFACGRDLLGKGEGGVGGITARQLEECHVTAPVGCDQLEGLSSDLGGKGLEPLARFPDYVARGQDQSGRANDDSGSIKSSSHQDLDAGRAYFFVDALGP